MNDLQKTFERTEQMNDKQDMKIIGLFWARDESAIAQTQEKYKGFCISILKNLTVSPEDGEECLNDALLVLWNTIPPQRPQSLSAYLAKILRNIALKKSRAENAWKRNKKYYDLREEFIGDISDGRTLAEDYESALAGKIINEFLDSISEYHRDIFVLRYWYGEDLARISQRTGRSADSIAHQLERLRKRLKAELIKEGILNEK